MLPFPPRFGNFFECRPWQSYPNLALDIREICVNAKRESGLQQHRLVGRESKFQRPRFLNRVFVEFHYALGGFERNRHVGT